MVKVFILYSLLFILVLVNGCESSNSRPALIQDIHGTQTSGQDEIWLSHEHILVDFIGADSIRQDSWNHDTIMAAVIPYLEELKAFDVQYFVDATPNYLGRDVDLLKKIADVTGLKILTNTGLYGARDNKYIPRYAYTKTADDLARMWINEYKNGIDGTSIKPGFIKIAVDNTDPLHTMHQKLVKAAALTHLETGLTIASHTGESRGLWPQLIILEEMGVSPEAFIWVHAQNEKNYDNYLKAAETGCWISLDGLGWELEDHIEKLLFARENKILPNVLISHDAGWYDPQKEEQSIQPYTQIFEKLFPALISGGFTEEEFKLLINENPSKAFGINIRKHSLE